MIPARMRGLPLRGGSGGGGGANQYGLRARVTLAFALGALAMSAVLSTVTYGLVRSSLVEQREDAALGQAFLNARLVRDALRTRADLGRVLSGLETPSSEGVVVRHEERWFASSLLVGADAVPAELREHVAAGRPARSRFRLGGRAWLAVGLPMPRVEAEFYQAFSLADADRTLGILAWSLSGAALLTTLAGAAVGRWVSGRVLRPLRTVSEAAAEIARGNMDIRLGPVSDRDIAPLAESFNSMVDALSQRIRRDARFASDVSHELRSPLTTLATSVEVLRARQDELSERGRSALDLLDADLRRFQRLVEDLLEISRADAGVADLRLEEVDVPELVRHALRSGHGAGLPLHIVGDGGIRILGDKRRLERVVGNLVENANAYGGGATQVSVERRDGTVRVAVEDAGPGVPPEERSQVFERFFRGSASGRRGTSSGTGLGLALVAEHVRLHGGRVWVEDGTGGRGARFVVELPRLP